MSNIDQLIKERDEARAVAAARVSGDPEVRDLLLHYFGTTEPELLRQSCESWIEAAKERDRLRRWKAEAMPIMLRYISIAESVGGKLGSNLADNLEKELTRLRAVNAELLTACETSLKALAAYDGYTGDGTYACKFLRAAIANARKATP